MADTVKKFFLDDEGVKLLWKKVLERTEGVASDTALTELGERVSANTQAIADEASTARAAEQAAATAAANAQSAVDALAETHATDKAALETKDAELLAAIEAEATTARAAEQANAAAAAKAQGDIDAFLSATDVGDQVVDTLKEIQDYITSDGEAADKMVKDISDNEAAIEAEVTRATGAEEALGGRIDTVAQAAADAETNANAYTDAEIAKIAAIEDVEALLDAASEEYESEKATA